MARMMRRLRKQTARYFASSGLSNSRDTSSYFYLCKFRVNSRSGTRATDSSSCARIDGAIRDPDSLSLSMIALINFPRLSRTAEDFPKGKFLFSRVIERFVKAPRFLPLISRVNCIPHKKRVWIVKLKPLKHRVNNIPRYRKHIAGASRG